MDELTLETRVSAHPMPRVTWLLNGSPLRVSDRYEQQQLSDGTCRLIVRGPEAADSGRYTCRAANLVSTDHVAHTLTFTGMESRISRVEPRISAIRSTQLLSTVSLHIPRRVDPHLHRYRTSYLEGGTTYLSAFGMKVGLIWRDGAIRLNVSPISSVAAYIRDSQLQVKSSPMVTQKTLSR